MKGVSGRLKSLGPIVHLHRCTSVQHHHMLRLQCQDARGESVSQPSDKAYETAALRCAEHAAASHSPDAYACLAATVLINLH